MNVWVVSHEVDYEGGSVWGVFSTEEAAADFVKAANEKYPSRTSGFKAEEFQLDPEVDL